HVLVAVIGLRPEFRRSVPEGFPLRHFRRTLVGDSRAPTLASHGSQAAARILRSVTTAQRPDVLGGLAASSGGRQRWHVFDQPERVLTSGPDQWDLEELVNDARTRALVLGDEHAHGEAIVADRHVGRFTRPRAAPEGAAHRS